VARDLQLIGKREIREKPQIGGEEFEWKKLGDGVEDD
jgi:hypothetical protein